MKKFLIVLMLCIIAVSFVYAGGSGEKAKRKGMIPKGIKGGHTKKN